MPDDLSERLARLNATVAKGIQERKEERARQWQRIKTKDPELAEWLTEMRREFPDSKVVHLEIDGEKFVTPPPRTRH